MKVFFNVYVKHGLIAVAICLVIIAILAKWLNIYTRHGQQVEVPNIKGYQVGEIENIFKQKNLRYTIIDSFFVKDNAPGSVLETVPPIGTHVKPGRMICLTINSCNALLLTIPTVQDMSGRQAQSLLASMGFEYIQTKVVLGAYKDLVIGLETEEGCKLNPGDRVAANTPLFILVSSGMGETPSSNDATDSKTEEPWY